MSVVYFIQAGTAGPIKIGVTANLQKRIAKMAIDNPHPLSLIGTISGQQPLEQAIHRHLWRDRVRGEWFHPNDRVHALIHEALAGRIAAHLAEGVRARRGELTQIEDDARAFATMVSAITAQLVAVHGLPEVSKAAGLKPRVVTTLMRTKNCPVTALAALLHTYPNETEELLSKLVRAA